MSEGRYNIPKQYKVDKGMPLEALFQKIDNLKCRRIFEAEIECVEWSYHLVDKEGVKDMKELIREPGLSVFEVKLKRKLSPELLTEVFTGLFFRPKLEIYKRIASLENEAECDDMRKELKDRFGTVPKSVENLIQISLIRVMAHRRYVTEIKGKMGQITFYMEPYAPVHVERLPELMAKYQGVLEFSAKGTPNFVLKYKKYGLIEKEAELMMSYTNKVLTDFMMLYDAQQVCAAT